MTLTDKLSAALLAKRESKSVDFKSSFDPGDWCELIKDLVAMANSGGGIIIIGVSDDGSPSGSSVDKVLKTDPAVITTKIEKYTAVQIEVDLQDKKRRGRRVAAFVIPAAQVPIVFSKPGTYAVEDRKQKTAFGLGTVYFRHGAKSIPGTTEDIRAFFERLLRQELKEWSKNVRKAASAPPGSKVTIEKGNVRESSEAGALPIRITDDPNAPAYRKLNSDDTHPHRMKELLAKLNTSFNYEKPISSHDLVCIRKLFGVDQDERLCYKPRFGSPQYSDALLDWFAERVKANSKFLENVRHECHERRVELGIVRPKK